MAERAESPQVELRTVRLVAAAILFFLVAVVTMLWLLFPQLINKPPPVAAQFPSPSVTADERMQRIFLERAQRERLTGQNGTMPIERAMAAVAAKGAAAYDPVQGIAP